MIKQLIHLGATINNQDRTLAEKANLLTFIEEEVKKYKSAKFWKAIKIIGIVIVAIGALSGVTYLLLQLIKKSKTEKPTENENESE